ncbi:beta-1,4-galactosyltransferase 4 [Brachionichthys hirsutus]|uniref:beta-1,4-galactosyltransferase 4 n=1 Tax=Brachionichthys hirsutus TaxID=412623 RepID=UPI00360439BC
MLSITAALRGRRGAAAPSVRFAAPRDLTERSGAVMMQVLEDTVAAFTIALAMRFRMPAVKILWKARYFLAIILSLSALAWLSTFSRDVVKSLDDASALTQAQESEDDQADDRQPWMAEATPSAAPLIPKARGSCPLKSPLLQGALKLSFDPSLKMEDVQKENEAVKEGIYEPADCTARQSVAILIPHRKREKHLLYLLHHLLPFLERQQLHFGIYVIHQAGDETFNRAKLLNVGYLEALKDHQWDCFVFHDVDLIPENDFNLYVCEKEPKHLVVGRNVTGYVLRYQGYFGGVTALSREQFLRVNGFSNEYWGWGGEDDDIRVRVTLQKMRVLRPSADVARYTMVFHKRDAGNGINGKRMELLAKTPQVWRQDGLNTCSYQTLSVARQPLYVNVTVDIGEPQS